MALSTTIPELFQGFLLLTLGLLPVTLFLTGYLTIMGGGHPDRPGLLKVLGVTVGFVYGTPLGVLVWLVAFSKAFDAVVGFVPLTTLSVTVPGLVFAAIGLVIAGNIFVDRLYQFKRGYYGLSVGALVAILGYVALVWLVAQAPRVWGWGA